ncbi:hypothetical protein M758_4G079800 [Ceratodon purpureus]|nr:hypothetical protein M758_4G079800 [Ceratodon purpureus]
MDAQFGKCGSGATAASSPKFASTWKACARVNMKECSSSQKMISMIRFRRSYYWNARNAHVHNRYSPGLEGCLNTESCSGGVRYFTATRNHVGQIHQTHLDNVGPG